MISSSKSPSRWRMALALPVLLTVVALACSKEQGATSVNENKTPPPPPPPPIKVVGATFTRDSVKVRFSNAGESVKEIHYISEVSSRDSIHVSGEPAVAKQAPAEIVVIGYSTPSDGKAVEKGQN